VRDLDSRNGVFLGESRLESGRDVLWRGPTMVRVGKSVFALDEPVSAALALLEAAEDEAMREEDVPAPPPTSAPRPLEGHDETGDLDAAPAQEAPLKAVESADLASLTRDVVPPKRRSKRAWTMTDLLVVTLALAVIGASLAGLVWVLR